jgi:hypothetical protein
MGLSDQTVGDEPSFDRSSGPIDDLPGARGDEIAVIR